MRKQKIYLETSLFNYYFDKDRDAHAYTVRLFEEIAAKKFEAYTSDAVTDELVKAPAPKNTMMLALIPKFKIEVLFVREEARKLADLYIERKIIPLKHRTDGIHIAMASVNDLDSIVSVNFRHIVKSTTKRLVSPVNALFGYRPIEIFSPMEIIENEDP